MSKPTSKQPPPPQDADTVLHIFKEKHSQRGQVGEKIQRFKEGEVNEIVAETNRTLAEVERVKAEKMLGEAKKGIYSNANSVIDRLFQGKSPEQVSEILDKMSPQAVQNLLALEKSADTPASIAVSQQPQGKTDLDRVLDVIKIMKEMQPAPQQQLGVAQIIEIVKAVQGGGGGGNNILETVKVLAEIQKPYVDGQGKDRDKLLEYKLKEIENKMPPDPIEQIKYIKEVAGTLGLTSGQKSELDLRLEEMRQEREVDMKRLDWEQKKYEMEADADTEKWTQITKILQGPIGQAIQGIGNAGADRVRGKPSGKMPKPVQTQCPQCSNLIFVDQDAEQAICGHCGAVLQKSGAVQPAAPTRVEEQPASPPEEQVEEQEQQEGEETDGHNEPEGEEGQQPDSV